MKLSNKLERHLKAEKIYYEQFWDWKESHSWLKKWIIVRLIKVCLWYKDNSKILYNLFMWFPLISALVYFIKHYVK